MNSHPSTYHPDLTEERLQYIASKIMDQVHLTYDTNTCRFDDAWTQGCTIFGRVKNLFQGMAKGEELSWMKLAKDGMGITPTIGVVPFRFASDNPEAPKKERILKQSIEEQKQVQAAFSFEDAYDLAETEILKWRWYIEKAYQEEDTPSVSFVGLNMQDEAVCVWKFDESSPQIHAVDGGTPPSKPTTEAPIHVPAAPINIKTTKQ